MKNCRYFRNKKKFLSKSLTFATPLAISSLAPVLLSTSCAFVSVDNNVLDKNDDFFIKANTNINLNSGKYDTWEITKNVNEFTNNEWVENQNLFQKINQKFIYSDISSNPNNLNSTLTTLFFETVNWDGLSTNANEVSKIKENATFTLEKIITNINGGVVINFNVSLFYYEGERHNPSYESGLKRSGTLCLSGFKPYTSKDTAFFNQFNVSVNSNIDYYSLDKKLSKDFFENEEATINERAEAIYEIVRNNWSRIFSITGLISSWDTTVFDDIFTNSLNQLIGSTTESDSTITLQVIGTPYISDENISFSLVHLNAGNGQIYNNSASISPVFLVLKQQKSLEELLPYIIGYSLIAGGSILLLIWLIVLIPSKPKDEFFETETIPVY